MARRKIYIVAEENYSEYFSIVGIYTSKVSAIKAAKEWRNPGFAVVADYVSVYAVPLNTSGKIIQFVSLYKSGKLGVKTEQTKLIWTGEFLQPI